MAKTKTGLFGFDARGSLGKTITFSKFRGTTVVKRIPTHPDARTLDQVYRRWLFDQARFYYRTLSSAQKEAYAKTGHPLNMSAWAYFLSLYLKNPFDILAWLRLDEAGGTLARDFPSNDHPATLNGPTWVTGRIAGALRSDCYDDNFSIPHHADFDVQRFAISLWFKTEGWWAPHTDLAGFILAKNTWWVDPISISVEDAGNSFLVVTDSGAAQHTVSFPIPAGWVHLVYQYTGADLEIWQGGARVANAPYAGDVLTNTDPLMFAMGNFTGKPVPFIVDDLRFYNRALSAEQILHIATQELY